MLVVFELLREVGIRMPRTVGRRGRHRRFADRRRRGHAGGAGKHGGRRGCRHYGGMHIHRADVYERAAPFPLRIPVCGIFLLILRRDRATLLLLAYLAQKESFGVSYLSPLAPVVPAGLLDFLLALPRRSMRRRDRLVGREKE